MQYIIIYVEVTKGFACLSFRSRHIARILSTLRHLTLKLTFLKKGPSTGPCGKGLVADSTAFTKAIS